MSSSLPFSYLVHMHTAPEHNDCKFLHLYLKVTDHALKIKYMLWSYTANLIIPHYMLYVF